MFGNDTARSNGSSSSRTVDSSDSSSLVYASSPRNAQEGMQPWQTALPKGFVLRWTSKVVSKGRFKFVWLDLLPIWRKKISTWTKTKDSTKSHAAVLLERSERDMAVSPRHYPWRLVPLDGALLYICALHHDPDERPLGTVSDECRSGSLGRLGNDVRPLSMSLGE